MRINGTTILWSSDNTTAMSDPEYVTLTATEQVEVITSNSKTTTKQFTTTTASNSSNMDVVAEQLKIPYILTPDYMLPVIIGTTAVEWSSSNTNIIDANGNIFAPSEGISAEVELTATITLDRQMTLTKTFSARVMENSPNYILSYIRSGDSNLTNSMHLGYSTDGQSFTALNYNTGVLFAKSDVTDNTIPGITQSLTNPYIFRMKDLSFGVVATRSNSVGEVLFATSNQLTSYKEVGLLTLSTTKTVNNPICEYDSTLRKYKISWVSGDGTAYYNTTDDFTIVSTPIACTEVEKPSIITDIINAIPSNVIPVTKAEGEFIKNKLSQAVNTGVNSIEVSTPVGTSINIDLLGNATLTYSDNTTVERTVTWSQSDFNNIDFSQEGIYIVGGTIKQTFYSFPMISGRADPNVIKYNGKYYFIATNESGQKTLEVRAADTIAGLASATDNTIFTANTSGDATGCIWAPEFHEINGELYIFVAAGSPSWNTVQSRVMKLNTGGNPIVASDWGSMQRVLNKDGGYLYTKGITLDMTYFEDAGRSYVIWAQRYIGTQNGLSQLYIGEVNPVEPWKLISDSVLISSPNYGWDRYTSEVNEGPFTLKHNGKIFVTFSGSNIDETYCVGLLTAAAGTNLLCSASWEKTNYPILTSESVLGEYGPGHNSFTIDEEGNDVLIYHARPSGGSRHMSARRVHWAPDGTPVLNMTDTREIANTNISAMITVLGSLQGDDLKIQSALNNITIPDADNLKESITLPTTGQFGTSLAWQSSNENVITATNRKNTDYADTPAGFVTRQDTDTTVVMTVIASLNGKTALKTIDVTVKARETVQKEYVGYLYAYFSGDSSRLDDQQIYFAVSKDGITWSDLNQNNPVLTSVMGDKGVRDPYIIRSVDGGKFYLIATDLDIRSSKYGNDWGEMSTQGSTSIMIWESTDLVNWSDQRMVDVASEVEAGAAWAPESIYDKVTGEYLVYWSSRVSADNFAKNRIYLAKTRDFKIFTTPLVYVDLDMTVIDASIFKEGDTYYRLIKDESTLSINLSYSNKLLDYSNQTALGNSFIKITNMELESYTGGYEGPTMFKFINQDKWCVLVDEYTKSKRGYIPFVSYDISAVNSLKLMDDWQYLMPTGAKHGTVITITQEEYDNLIVKWGIAAPNEAEQINPILYYDFNEVLPTNKTIEDKSGNNHTGTLFGNATYVEDIEKGQVLYLDGTSNTFAAFPQGFFDGRNVMSISMDIKPEMTNNYFFTFTIGQNTSKYMFLRTRQDQIRNAITTQSYSKERDVLTTGSFLNKWINVKIIMNGHQMSMYVDGTLVGTNNYVRSINDLGNNLLAYLGKSFYSNDLYFKGYYDNIKVYNRVLTKAEIKEENAKTILSKDKELLTLEEIVVSNITLPSSGANGSTITWKSSNTAYITNDGVVTRPEQGDVNVTMIATLSLDSIQLTKEFNIIVFENSQIKDLAFLNSVAASFEINITYVTEDLILPTYKKGVSINWKTSNEFLISDTGIVTRPQAGDQKVILTAILELGQTKVEKAFKIIVAEKTWGYLLSYVVNGNTDRTDCLHIAYSRDGQSYTPLHDNRGILYTSEGAKKMGSPVIFRKVDGTYGLIASDNNESSYIIIWDSDDLVTYKNERYVKVNSQGIKVLNPFCRYDMRVNAYRIDFEGSDGKSYTTTTDFVSFTKINETTYIKPVVTANLPTGSIEAGVFEVTKSEYDRVVKKYLRIINIGITPIPDVKITVGNTFKLPEKVTAKYSDGSTKDMGVVWNQDELFNIDTSKEGTYKVTGTVQQKRYTNPLIEERADPWAIYDEGTGYYYFTASYPVRGDSDPEGYDRIILRRSTTIEGLATAPEITIWDEKDSSACFRYIWAPEIHMIKGKWYVLYTASRSSNVWDIRPHILACERDGDPYNQDNWVEKGQIKPAADDRFAFTHFSLDMTYFENNDKHYVVWAEKPGGISNIYMATIDPEKPWQLTSKAILMTTPEFAWEWKGSTKINEGPSVIKNNGKIFLCYSAAAVDESYSMGMLTANENADLMDISSWIKNAYPLLTSNDLFEEYGPGHNSFTVDQYGNPVIVYHARPKECYENTCEFASSSDLNDPHRHARVKNVIFTADGSPILNMTYDEELADEFKTVSIIVKVIRGKL